MELIKKGDVVKYYCLYCVGFSDDIHKIYPYSCCNGIAHEISKYARML